MFCSLVKDLNRLSIDPQIYYEVKLDFETFYS